MKRLTTVFVLLWMLIGGNRAATTNPIMWADVPDPDVIRVGEYYYMVSTTMHLMPGGPIMRSKDLAQWETIGYLFDRLTDSPKYDLLEGTVYGRGQWATSLRYHKGQFYALFSANESGAMNKTYIMTAKDAAGPWKVHSRLPHFHDAALFFDDDDRVYVVYGTGDMCELTSDLQNVVEGSRRKIFEREADETGLLEGSRMLKHNGRYYLLMISHVWAPGRHRREVCYRADNITGPYEKKVILETDFGGFPHIGQGTIVDGNDGKWYGIIFQDRGGVGRVLTQMPCTWKDGWPILGDKNGHVPMVVKGKPTTLLTSDDFSGDKLNLLWQWNHNPINEAWSLSERKGWLRLKTARVVDNLFAAPNTLSQRMVGPKCSASVKLDVSKMRDGDAAGFCAFQGDAALVSVVQEGSKRFIVANQPSVQLDGRDKRITGCPTKEIMRKPLNKNLVWFRIDCDFNVGKDLADLYYSLDGKNWTIAIPQFKMNYDYRRLFMGTRYAIFNYATKALGGYVDVDEFIVNDKQWTGTWATAPEFTGKGDMPQTSTLTGNAIRQIIHVSLGGEKLRLHLSNEFSQEPTEIKSIYIADAKDAENIDAKTAKYITFDCKQQVTIEPGKAICSDDIAYQLKPLQRLAITINYGSTPKNATSHRGSRTTSYIMKGESKPKQAFKIEEALDHWYNIASIDVVAEKKECWAVLGNSITDGRGTTTNLQNRWTDVCAEELGGEVGILNLGIGGNCVLRGGLSQPAMMRFDRDIMGQRGLTGIIIYEGINDIGGSMHAEQTSKELIAAYEKFIDQAHADGLKVVGGTITQMGNTNYYSFFHEALRQNINDWIRNSGRFDAVIDFDAVIRNPADPTKMNDAYQYDWLHPNAAGYKAMGIEAAKVLKTVQ